MVSLGRNLTENEKIVGKELVENSFITQEQLHQAGVLLENGQGSDLNEVLTSVMKLLSPGTYQTVWAFTFRNRVIDLNSEKIEIDPEAVKLVPRKVAQELKVFPMRLEDGKLVVAMEDPLDKEAKSKLSEITGKPVKTYLPLLGEIPKDLYEQYYPELQSLCRD
ncbi:MAG: hypothetical protein HYS60_03115 [Candidatus Wildermuthbacteria bacterium]|nr:hypothetical protein [Candidatus Wildermuthbacteria bacterium]